MFQIRFNIRHVRIYYTSLELELFLRYARIVLYQQAAAAWALGQAGRHTPEHAKAVALANVLPALLSSYLRSGSSEDLQTKVLCSKLLDNGYSLRD